MDENILGKIAEIFGTSPQSFSILEEKVELNEQMEYFEYPRKFDKIENADEVTELSLQLHDSEVSVEDKKRILVQLASINRVDALRAIEKCLDNENWILHNWATLAFQESKMLVVGSIMDEKQVFISTGLGGKGHKLRYFIALKSETDQDFTEIQQKILKNEIDFTFQKNEWELEEIHFESGFATILVVIPLNSNIRDIFVEMLNECNQFGNFISRNFMVTNVKSFSIKEIKEFMDTNSDIENENDDIDIDTNLDLNTNTPLN